MIGRHSRPYDTCSPRPYGSRSYQDSMHRGLYHRTYPPPKGEGFTDPLTWTPPVCQVTLFDEVESIAVLHPACRWRHVSWPLWNSPAGPFLSSEVVASRGSSGSTRRGSTCFALVLPVQPLSVPPLFVNYSLIKSELLRRGLALPDSAHSWPAGPRRFSPSCWPAPRPPR